MEGSFQLYYGIDLRVAVETESPRRLWALVQGLPPDAAVWRNEPAGWTMTHELLAQLVEVTSQGQIKVPRPNGLRAEGPRGDNVVEIADFVSKFGGHARGGEK